ncbi:hypothetical protein JB92DRAFT_419420 [Gautieria morchelliformis]|nr:hypothetical protein JB92DRAFT_419420 [Gautieria morchelliformis]
MGIADALIMLRVSVLWGRQRFILVICLLSFFITFSAATISTVTVSTKLVATMAFVPYINICLPLGNRDLVIVGVWVPGMVFDGLVLSLSGWNAYARPRAEQTAFTVALYRDGVVAFLILAGLRACSLIFSTFNSRLYLLGLCISWPMSTITLSRFIFRLRSLEKGPALPSNSSTDIGVTDAESGSCGPEASSVPNQTRHDSLGLIRR